MTDPLIKTSKFLSFVLRHKPEEIGLKLDPEGWALVDELVEKAGRGLTHELIEKTVTTNDKQRFALSADRRYIRANQGHSLKVDLGLSAVRPPELLFHGTATRFLEQILAEGLRPQNRQYVHLSADKETAVKVGQRHGKPFVLTIPALAMHTQGHRFLRADNGVWLTKSVPASFLAPSSS